MYFQGYKSYSFDPTTNTYTMLGPKYTISTTNRTLYDFWSGQLQCYTLDGDGTNFYKTDVAYRIPSQNSHGWSIAALVQENILAPAGTYPTNGLAGDGYWYTMNPLEVVSPTQNQTLSESASMIPTVIAMNLNGTTLNLAYYIDSETSPRDTKVISNTATPQTVSFQALDIGTLTEGPHTFRFTLNDGVETVQKTVNIVVDKSPPVLWDVSFTSSDTMIQISGSVSDTISGLDSTPYQYSVGSDVSSWTSTAAYSKNNLMPNTKYLVKFVAKDIVGHIATREQDVYTKAKVPLLNVSQVGETTLDILLQDDNPSSTSYQLFSNGQYVNETGTMTASPVWITSTNKKVIVKGLNPNTSYTFQAKARNDAGEETSFSSPIGATTLANPPANLFAEASQRSIKITWPETPGASYDIEVDGIVSDNGSSMSFLHSALTPNTLHTYRVRVRNAGGTGNWSTTLTKFTLPDPPSVPLNIQTMPMQTDITVTWDTVAHADSYDVEADGAVIGNSNQTTFIHQGLQPLTDHKYRIRAVNSGGASQWSEPVLQKTLPYPPNTPENVTAQPSIHTVAVNWTAAEGATDYEIEADGLLIDNGNQTYYQDKDLEPLTGHTYKVRAKNAGGISPWSNPVHITTHPEISNAPTNLMATSEVTSISMTWYKVSNTDSYDVEIDGTTVVNVMDNQFVHNGLTSDSKHTYRVRAKNISGDSNWSTPISILTLPQGSNSTMSLTNIAAIVTNTFITISWDTVASLAQYDIEVDGVLSDNGKNTIFNHSGLKANEFHTYKIRVKDGGKLGDWVAILSLSTLPDPPDAPSSVEAFPTNNAIELRWQKVAGASGYDVEIDGKTIDTGAESSYIHGKLAPGTAHTYRVRAKNMTGVTAWSPSIVKSTTSPTYQVNVTKDKPFNMTLFAYNVQDFSQLTYVVTYNPSELEVTDLYNFTPFKDVTGGKVPGSNLTVTTFEPGKIIFKVNQNVVPGTSWSGEISTIEFKSLINGQALIDVVAE